MLYSCTNTAKPNTLSSTDSQSSSATVDASKMNSTTAATSAQQALNANQENISTTVSEQPGSANASSNGSAALGLTDPLNVTAYSIGLVGCATGYTSTATLASPNLQVYKQDKSCLAELNSVTYNGSAFTPKAGAGFTTWLAGDTATFSATGMPDISVKVLAQLSSPILSADTVSYQFYVITQGTTNTVANTVVGEAHSMSVVGQDPPDYDISVVTFGGVSVSGGSGLFTFKMGCHTAAVTGTSPNNICTNVPLTQIKYKLVQDTYSGVLTIQQAQTIMSAGTSSVLDTTDYIAPSGTAPTNGGFVTGQLTGPSQMSVNPNMLLVLQSNGLSYEYWKVQVQALVQQ